MIVDIPEAVLRRAIESFRRESGYGHPESQYQRARQKDAETMLRAVRLASAAAKAKRPKKAEPNGWQQFLAVRAEIEGRD
jgi:DNA-directed RNA polymerase